MACQVNPCTALSYYLNSIFRELLPPNGQLTTRISNLHADHVEFKIQPVVPFTLSLTVFGWSQFTAKRLLFQFVEVSHRTKHGRVQFSCYASESQAPFTFILKCWRDRSGDTNCEGFQSIPPFPSDIKGLFEGICKCAPVRKSKSQLQIQ